MEVDALLLNGMNEAVFQEMLQHLPGEIYWKDRHGFILGCNLQKAKSAGFHSPQEMIGKTDQAMPWKNKAAQIRAQDQMVLRTGQPLVFFENNFSYKIIPLRNEKQQILGILNISQAESSTQTCTQSVCHYLEGLISAMPGSIYWKNKEGIYLGCNDSAVEMAFLKTKDQYVGKTDYEIFDRETADQFRHNDLRVMLEGKEISAEENTILPDGSKKVALSTKKPLRDAAGNLVGVLGVSIDITERKKMEEKLRIARRRILKAEKANQAKTDFLTVMSHELRTPLNGILGAAQILNARLPRADQRGFIDDIYRSGNILLSLVNDILDLSKLEAGKLELNSVPCDLKEIIDEMTSALSYLAKEKKIKLTCHYSQKTPRYIFSDIRRLRQVLFNLIGNALKYTDRGRVAVHVQALSQQADQTTSFKIVVRDTGVGIPADKMPILFERFTQVHPYYAGHYRGTGLGLAIVKQIVEQMGGHVTVESEEQKGSAFSVFLNFKLASAKEATITWPEAFQKQRLLLIHDVRKQAREILTQLAHPHATVVSFKQALPTFLAAKKKGSPYHVILLHEGRSFHQTLKKAAAIRKRFSLTNQYLFLLTHLHHNAIKEKAKQSGCHSCIYLPIKGRQVLPYLLEVMGYSSAKKTSAEQLKPLAQKRILLVEDNMINQRVAETMLKDEGATVDIVDNGEKALVAIKDSYDAILMDIGLPDMDGYEVTRCIRKRMRGKKRIPIIALTANAFEQDSQKSLSMGMDGFLSKPVSQKSLLALLLKHL